MTSVSAHQDGEHVTENTSVTTIHRIYRGDNEDLVLRDPNNRRSYINRPAYAKLHRSFSSGSKRHSVDNLKGRFENIARQNSDETPEQTPEQEKFTPASFGYPKSAKLSPPLIKPKPAVRKRSSKDENSNVVKRVSESSDAEEVRIVLQPSASEESVDKIAKELNNFTMDGKPNKKRVGSFRKLFLGGLFGKDKKKKEERKSGDNVVYNDNLRNESAPVRPAPTQNDVNLYNDRIHAISQEVQEMRMRELEQEYAQLHVNRFHSIRQSFNDDKTDNYVVMDNTKTKTINDFVSTPVNKYIDTSSSASAESEKPNGLVRDTPPRAQETYQNIKVVKPKAAIPISTERPLPNPYQNEKTSPRTIERNLNKSNSKDYPDKRSFTPDETYGTVFDSLEYAKSRNGDIKRPPLSPIKPSLESTKLKLPPNREIYEPQPRVKSPIPTNKVSTEKIIATELLKNTRSPTPPKRTVSVSKPPMSPKSPKKEPQSDKIVTNAMVHAPRRAQTPLENRNYSNLVRASTPVDLRMSVSMKMSPKKEEVRKSVEEYYWKELKKLKEQEDSKLYSLQSGYYEDQRLRRSRSLSPSQRGRRSLSLPRDGRGQSYVDYARVPQQSIPEDQALMIDGQNRYFVYDQNFVRNNPERRSVDSLQRPIFRRGSLTKQEIYESSPYNKRVSFSNGQSLQQWPTRNGYNQQPPQRKLERMGSELEDEVFLQEAPRYVVQNEPVYSNRVLEQFRAQQQYDNMRQQQLYGQVPPQMGYRLLSMESLPRQQEVYGTRPPMVRRPVSNDYGGTNVQHSQLSLQPSPVYASRQSITDSNYGKQITLRNKYCDIYGQIHDAPQSGVVMGQLQPQMVPRQPETFVRGSRLTASANDLGKRYANFENSSKNYENPLKNYENRPLPPPPPRRIMQISDTESGSDASEIQRIMQKSKKRGFFDEEWNADGKSGRSASGNDSGRSDNEGEVRGGRSRNTRRDDPRRHTLGADQQYLAMAGQGGPLARTMDLEGQPRGYPPPSNAMLFDDDPGIMSEVETSSTGFRRGGKQRSSLPVVRTPSKTLERPLGLVFLQYRNETKRALLPNEITSIDTVKALFVRSFPKQLTMEYLDSPNVKIYIHDSSKDMFYELEDLRSHLREIRDRSVLRLFESADVSGGLPMAGIGIAGGVGHFEDPSYFSEPEFDSEYQHQHIHKSKGSAGKGAPYYMGSTASLPRGATLLRTYSPAVGALPADRLKSLPTDGYMSSPERGSRYEDPYYSQYASRSGSITPVIDEEVSDTELLDDSYSLYGVKLASGVPRGGPRSPFPPPAAVPYDATRLRVENMERQLANLTGLVQKALTQTPTTHLQVPGRENYRTERDRLKPAPPPKPASLSPGQYDQRMLYRDLQLTPEMYNQLRGLQKKAKDLRAEVRNLRRMSQAQAHSVRETIRDTFIKIRAMLLAGGEQVWQAGMDQERVRLSREEDLYKQEMLRLEKDLSDLESTVEELRGNVINRKTRVNMSDVENMALVLSKSSKTVADLKLRFPGLQDGMKTFLSSEMEKVMREEKFLKEEPERLESALRRCKKLTGTLVTLKRLASVQEQRLPCSNSSTDGRLSPTATETPPITPTSSTHSKPPSGARVGSLVVGGESVNTPDGSQRPENALDALLDELQTFSKPHSEEPPAVPAKGIPPTHPPHMSEIGRKGSMDSATFLPTQNLTVSTATGSLRRLHSYPSGSDTDNSPPIQPQKTANKPPIPERNAELLQHITGRRVPPPPPPRTSSKSPLASPTSPSLPPRSPAAGLQHIQNVQNMVENKPQSQFEAATQNLGLATLRRNVPTRSSIKDKSQTLPRNIGSNLLVPQDNEAISQSNSSSCESVNSQDGSKKTRKEELEQRHQELLKKQKALQEQYARLQQLQRGNNTLAVVPPAPELLKKTGSESNLLQKMGLQMSTSQITGSLTNLPNTTANSVNKNTLTNTQNSNNTEEQTTTTNKVYETDIL